MNIHSIKIDGLRVWIGVLAILLSMFTASNEAAANEFANNDWYMGLSAGVIVTDDNFNVDGHFESLRVGRRYGKQNAFEVEVLSDELDFGVNYNLRHQSIGINHRTINDAPLWDPYFLVGIALDHFDAPNGDRSGQDIALNLGVGGEWELMAPRRVFLRLDVRLRYDFNDSRQPGQIGFGDGIIGLGLTMPFYSSKSGS